mmetsp:Transcript_9421/g.22396  ORF Transcript_9421/g.22396 Transcript_9421/m.22396 type:complete len:162 (+) Transcript_9421:430-915(+)
MRVGDEHNYFHRGPLNRLPPQLLQAYNGDDDDARAHLYFHCAAVAAKDDPAIIIFIATDNAMMVEKAKTVFGADKVVVVEGGHEHSGMISAERHTERGQLKAMADWFLLGEAQLVYRTYWSTYGFTALLRTGAAAVVIPQEYDEQCRLPTATTMIEYTNHC